MKRRSLVSGFAAALIGITLFSTSLISCGCAPAWVSFLHEMGFKNSLTQASLAAEIVEQSAKSKFVGQNSKILDDIHSFKKDGCVTKDESGMECIFWLEHGIARDYGLQVKFVFSEDKIIRSIAVRSSHRLFGIQLPHLFN
jgi:hypothetical protein